MFQSISGCVGHEDRGGSKILLQDVVYIDHAALTRACHVARASSQRLAARAEVPRTVEITAVVSLDCSTYSVLSSRTQSAHINMEDPDYGWKALTPLTNPHLLP